MTYDYTTPSQEVFEEMQKIAISIWETYDNQFGYVTEKIEKVKSLENIQDNAMVFYRMLDWNNQEIFKSKATQKTIEYINTHN